MLADDSPLSFSRMLERQSLLRTFDSIENLLWLIAALLLVLIGLQVYRLKKDADTARHDIDDWAKNVETAYNRGDFDQALEILESTELLFPASGWVLYWRGRCYFQQERWEDAAETFEALLRKEPIFRRSVKDYMVFIEINGLADGVSGYANPDA